MKNFTKHAQHVGYITTAFEVVWAWLTSIPGTVYIDDDGCLHSEGFVQ